MNRILLVVAALVAVSVVAALLLLSDGTGPDPAVTAAPLAAGRRADAAPAPIGASSAAAEAAPLRAQADAPLPDAVDGLAAAAPTSALAHLQGTLSLPGGDPAVGLTLALELTPAGAEQPLLPTPAATTDAAGRFDFALDLAVPHQLLALLVQPGTPVPRQRLALDRPLLPGQTLEHDLTVTPGVSLAGTVVDLDGQPVPGAEIQGWTGQRWQLGPDRLAMPERTVTADSLGRFVLTGVGSPWLLEARAEGLVAHARLHGELAPGGALEGLTLTLSPARRLTGRVLGAGARPLADALIQASVQLVGARATLTEHEDTFLLGPRTRSQRSDADGRFDLGLLAAREVSVSVEHDSHPRWEGRHGPGDGELVVQLEPGLSLAGRVLGAAGQPVAGASLRLSSTSSFRGDVNNRQTTSAADGRFVFAGLQTDDKTWLVASAPGHGLHVEQPLAVLAEGNPELTVVLPPARRLAGHVVDAEGQPIAGARVSIEGDRLIDHGNVTIAPPPTWERQVPGLSDTTTDAAGAFAIEGLYDGAFRVEASAGQSGLRSVVETRSGDERLVLVLDPHAVVGVTLTGTAIDASTGLPVTEFRITPMIPQGSGGMTGMGEQFKDPDGRWRLPGLDPGPMLVTAQASGYAPWSHELVDYLEGEHRVDVAFAPTRSVHFVVVDTQGGLAPARLTFADARGRPLMVETGPGSGSGSLQTDDAGRALAAGLPAERIVITTQRDYLSPSTEHHVDLTLAPSGPVELVYDAPAEQDITVVVLAGAPADTGALSQDDWMAVAAAAQGLADGSLRAPTGPVSVRATDSEGHSVRPAADAALDPRLPESLAPYAHRLHVTAREWTFVASSPPGPPAERRWSPDEGRGPEIIVLLLPEG